MERLRRMSEKSSKVENEKYVWFNGKRYTRQKDGRYIGSYGKILHRDIWEYFNGEIPKGYVIHHIDGVPSNNDLSNLQIMTQSDHIKLHQKIKKWVCKYCGKEFESNNLGVECHFCSNVCKSKYDYENSREVRICEECAKEFLAYKYGKTKYCSKECTNKALSRKYFERNHNQKK